MRRFLDLAPFVALTLYGAGRLIGSLVGRPEALVVETLASSLLALGLYLSVLGIDRQMFSEDAARISAAVGVGVLAKAVAVFAVVRLFLPATEAAALALVFSQVDPLSTGVSLLDRAISARARSFLLSWASFDDPVTTILAVGLLGVAGTAIGSALPTLWAWIVQAALLLVLGTLSKKLPAFASAMLAITVIGLAAYAGTFLATAVLGLVYRPVQVADRAEQIVAPLYLAAITLTGLAVTQVELWIQGVGVAAVAFATHFLISKQLTSGFSSYERLKIGLGHQSGLTALVLVLTFETRGIDVLQIAAPGILASIVIHLVSNLALQRWPGRYLDFSS